MYDLMSFINKFSIWGELISFVKDYLFFGNFCIRWFLYEFFFYYELFIFLWNDILKEYLYISLFF